MSPLSCWRPARLRSVSKAKMMVTALRSLLRFLHVEGVIEPVAGRRGADGGGLAAVGAAARAWNPSEVRRAAGDAAIGARRWADVISRSCCCWRGWGCARGEVAGLGLDDIDWRAGEIDDRWQGPTAMSGSRCRPTSARRSPPTCAAAGRRAPQDRSVFVRVKRAASGPDAGRGDARSSFAAGAARRAGQDARRTGCGTPPRPRCCARGAPLPEVGQVLRHRRAGDDGDLRQGRPGALRDAGPCPGRRERVMTAACARRWPTTCAMRRALGYQLARDEQAAGPIPRLPRAAGARSTVTVAHALGLGQAARRARHGAGTAYRLRRSRGFARYLHDDRPGYEVPPADLLPSRP